ncbi:MAG: Crp/Fnr family transcriptional regulator [Sphingopyxis sp.]|nr:MAG: Crp/Fnr family transcriptional regulator [Sphingopyxis sp.]
MTGCDHCVVRNRAICSTLDAAELAALNQISHHRDLKAGQTLAWEGDESFQVANVIEGVLKLSASLSDGREQIVGVAYPSDFIGRPYGSQNRQTITAITDVRLCTFRRADFERFSANHPDLEHKILQRTLTELDRARQWMLLLGRKSAREKLASFLLEMSERLADSGCQSRAMPTDQFGLPFGRQQIADILGLTIETVSRQLTELKKSGLIELPDNRKVVIKDRKGLEQMTDQSGLGR